MKEAEEKKPKQEKEIDLLEVSGNVAKSLKNATVNLFAALWHVFVLIVKKGILLFRLAVDSWILIVIALAIIAGAAFFMYESKEAYYVTEGEAISRISSSSDIIQIINSVSVPDDESNIAVNNDLNLKPEVYKNVVSIKAASLIDIDGDGVADIVDYKGDYKINKERDSLAVRMDNRFNIALTLKDQTFSNEIQLALKNYLNNHPYLKDKNDRRIENYKALANIYEQQAEVLDSLQKYEYFEESKLKENNVQSLKFGEFELIGSDEQKDKRLYHTDIISLKNQEIMSKASISFEKDPIVFIGTSQSLHQHNSLVFYLKKMMLWGLPLFFIFFIILKQKEIEKIFNINEFLEK